MSAAAAATFALSYATTYPMMLVAALGVGLAGGSFAVGVAYVSRWYPKEKQGTALGIFGVGNVGAAVTKFIAPFVMVAFGWMMVAKVWAIVLVLTAIVFWIFTDDDPVLKARRKAGEKPKGALLQMEPLKNLQVWRFATYYFFVFGGFVALALWLPRYLIGVYDLDIKSAGMIAALFSIPASIFRAYGGHLSDKFGARSIMYWTFGMAHADDLHAVLPEHQTIRFTVSTARSASPTSMSLVPFIIAIFILGFFMSLGKAAVYKHIPVYYPDNVGAVGGLVGMIGGLGGFILPLAFGFLLDLTGIWTSSFMLLFLVVSVSMLWMHLSIRNMERKAYATELEALPELPEMQPLHGEAQRGALSPKAIQDWRPDDENFWETEGKRIAKRNLWISIPALLLAFSVWMVWSVVVAKLPAIGFTFSTDQLFWLAALPGLSGATLRIFYSFMVPIFGGRLWTTLTYRLIAAAGLRYRLRRAESGNTLSHLSHTGAAVWAWVAATLPHRCRTSRSSFPRKKRATHWRSMPGLGNLGVSVMQFLVPLVITVGVFGVLGGEPVRTDAGAESVDPERRLHLGTVSDHCNPGRLVRHERHRLGQSLIC